MERTAMVSALKGHFLTPNTIQTPGFSTKHRSSQGALRLFLGDPLFWGSSVGFNG
uniref:Uncharacterized protein n=1 Tax=Anguilla anguilla TaxID=7936 RepID=A0A0E9VG94_ANGAN